MKRIREWFRRGGQVTQVWLDATVRDGVQVVIETRSPSGRRTRFSTKDFRVLSLERSAVGWLCYRTGRMAATLTAPTGAVLTIETLEF